MPKIAIVIPCYNEEHRLPTGEIATFLARHPDVFVWLIDAGSSDKTGDVIDNLAQKGPTQVSTIHLEHNVGKAEAVRQGMIGILPLCDAAWFGYWDADLAAPLEEIDHLLSCAEEQTRLLMCSRAKRLGARAERRIWRRVLGKIMAGLISLMLKFPFYDTQCGAKLIHHEAARDIFSDKFLSRWLFDVEIIARTIEKYPNDSIRSRILEVPVHHWKEIPGSKLMFKHMLISLVDLVRIYFKLRIHRG